MKNETERKVSSPIVFYSPSTHLHFSCCLCCYEATSSLTLTFSFLLSADSKNEEQPVTSENLRESLKKELEFYFSR